MAAVSVLTPAVSVLTIDKEAAVRVHLRALLSLDPECELIGECSNGLDAVRSIGRTQPDILFVDANAPGLDGFEVVRAISQRPPIVIFTSDSGESAVRAFEARVFDYLLKPLEESRFRNALCRAKAEIARANPIPQTPAPEPVRQQSAFPHSAPRRIAIRENGRVFFVTIDQIDWVEAADNYVCVHAGSDTHILRQTMKQMEASLDPSRFIRIHRSTIVNIDRVKELQPWFRGEYRVILRDGTQLVLTKTHREKLDAQLLLGSLA